MRLLRIKDVENKTGIKRSMIYKKIQEGLFPKPYKLSNKCSVWLEEEVDEVIRAWLRGSDEKELKLLVERLRENIHNLQSL